MYGNPAYSPRTISLSAITNSQCVKHAGRFTSRPRIIRTKSRMTTSSAIKNKSRRGILTISARSADKSSRVRSNCSKIRNAGEKKTISSLPSRTNSCTTRILKESIGAASSRSWSTKAALFGSMPKMWKPVSKKSLFSPSISPQLNTITNFLPRLWPMNWEISKNSTR